jgi:hypothetical protein
VAPATEAIDRVSLQDQVGLEADLVPPGIVEDSLGEIGAVDDLEPRALEDPVVPEPE